MPVFQSLNEVIEQCDTFPYPNDAAASSYPFDQIVPFRLGPYVIGHVLPDVVASLKLYNQQQTPAPFVISTQAIEFSSWVNSPDSRTAVVETLMNTWRDNKTWPSLSGWRNELYPVYGDPSQPDNIAFVMERAATPLFGISTFGVHLNAFTRNKENGSILMWVAKRSLTKQTWPGLLDNCVAGGISYKYSVKDTIIKECEEEASIPHELACHAKSVNALSYYAVTSNGLQPETQYVFDLELPNDFSPTPCDGEVECFYQWPLSKVKETMLSNEWKPNCALVAIDFMMRHSYITPDEEPDYISLTYRLHRQLEFPTPKKN
ncbi:NUDIX hydrolase domain-like protein [Blakeslea trispora]|nr:NUDIX hydrolase domain-like protein [Blakeslea trispora]